MKHLISIDDLEPGERAALFKLADELIRPTAISTQAMAGKILANVLRALNQNIS